jgi:hypothetical protein
MNFLNSLMESLNGQMNRPVSYQSFSESWFHYLSFLIVIVLAIAAVQRMKNASDKKWRIFTLSVALLLIGFEIYKQLNFSYTNNWNYRWYAFPFQFCSTPMYVALLAGILKKGPIQNALYAFLGTFGLFAGTAVMLIPNDVFITTIGINIQTMIHHGAMVVIGAAIAAHKLKLQKQILPATIVFAVTLIIAMFLNIWHNSFIQEGTFNMFFINPVYKNHLPILSMIQPLVPYPIFLAIYTIGFGFAAYIVLNISLGIKKLAAPKTKKALQSAN